MSWQPSWGIVAVAAVAVVAGLVALARAGRADRGSAVRRLAAALLLVGVGLRPSLGTPEHRPAAAAVDVVVLVDRTTSMAAEDHAGTQRRLAGAAQDVAALVRANPGARFSVIAFDNGARVVSPFTTDAAATNAAVEAMGWREAAYGTGSDIGVGVGRAAEVLQLSRTQGSRARFLVYAGDGEQTADRAPESFAPLRPLVDGSLVLGYGTPEGGRMLERVGSTQYVTVDGRPALSHLDEGNLRRIAAETGGAYQHRPSAEPLVLPGASGPVVGAPTERPATEVGWAFGLAAALLLVWELGVGVRRWHLARKELL